VNEFQNAVLLEGHETDVEIPHNVKMHAQKGKKRHPCKYGIAESVPKSTNDQLEKKSGPSRCHQALREMS
jgi:hypothetical protein